MCFRPPSPPSYLTHKSMHTAHSFLITRYSDHSGSRDFPSMTPPAAATQMRKQGQEFLQCCPWVVSCCRRCRREVPAPAVNGISCNEEETSHVHRLVNGETRESTVTSQNWLDSTHYLFPWCFFQSFCLHTNTPVKGKTSYKFILIGSTWKFCMEACRSSRPY